MPILDLLRTDFGHMANVLVAKLQWELMGTGPLWWEKECGQAAKSQKEAIFPHVGPSTLKQPLLII